MDNQFFDKKGNIIDYYTIFNIPYNANIKEIKSAFRILIKRYHPDTTENLNKTSIDKIEFIIMGYRILADDTIRKLYNEHLFKKIKLLKNKYTIIPKDRIRYSASLKDMLKARLLPKGIKRKDILYNFGQDIEIFITDIESKKGSVAFIELPARMHCPLCSGGKPGCYVCKGIGRINTSSQLQVKIPTGIKNGTHIDVDLLKMKPDKLTVFKTKSLKIKISIINDSKI